jgi:Ala-tRNA(Pro) deacylase
MYVFDFLKSQNVWFASILHRPASSSARRASSIHVPGGRVAKTVLVRAGQSYLLAVLPSTSRIDLERLSAAVALPASDVRLASADELREIFADCEPGVVPPFGRLYGLTTVVDSTLAGIPEIVFAANTRHEGLRMQFDDYEALESPLRASFTRPITGDERSLPDKRDRNGGRRAG